MKKIILLLLAALLPMAASAYDAEIGGIFYNFSGDETEVTYQKYENYKYISDYFGTIEIPETVTYRGTNYTVTSIGDCAFASCSRLTSITIPNSVTSIDREAFNGCSSLTSVTIPESVTNIDLRAFANCSAMTSITIPNGVTNINQGVFRYCI